MTEIERKLSRNADSKTQKFFIQEKKKKVNTSFAD